MYRVNKHDVHAAGDASACSAPSCQTAKLSLLRTDPCRKLVEPNPHSTAAGTFNSSVELLVTDEINSLNAQYVAASTTDRLAIDSAGEATVER